MSVRTDFPPGQGCRSDDLRYEGESISVIAGPRNQPSSEVADGLKGFVLPAPRGLCTTSVRTRHAGTAHSRISPLTPGIGSE
jgi:hypothetical protein